MKTLRLSLTVLCFIAAATTIASAQNREQDHDELRALLRAATEAMNSKNFDSLTPLFHDQFSITTVDQKLFTSISDFKAYYESLLGGPSAPLKSIAFNPQADDLTVFVGNDIGLSHGTSTDTYYFSDGDTRTMTSRWTATVYRKDGKWKILNVHIGTDLLHNPVLDAAKSYVYKAGIGAGIGGLVIGFLVAWFARGRVKR